MKSTPESLAATVEAFFAKRDIHLTMGGEPTFVPLRPDAPEWNNAAMGEEKLGYARRFTRELLKIAYPGGLAMQVFGKHYPGEPLPRWNMLTLHPSTGAALWPEPERLMLDDKPGHNDPDCARKLIKSLTADLDLDGCDFPAVEQGERKTAAWVLPLDYAEGKWISDPWPFSARQPLRLFPGDSPAGLRLPLYQLDDDRLKRALTVEVRHGALEVFIPPLEWTHFRELVAFIFTLARKHDLREMVFCGYAPFDCGPTVEKFSLAADPGVLEANLPPCPDWVTYRRCLDQMYATAESTGLRAIKLHLNGSVQATGGGSHLCFGGPDEARNPFHRDPALLASILRYWQHHPALGYFFTGQYVGTGCQAPRIDESGTHAAYELELACEALENSRPDPEQIDRLLRNLLTDSSGNTHRAEICVDKFHNYAAPNGKTGIIELRAFEVFPTAEMLGLAGLFIRTVIARLAAEPFTEPMRRFGPELHDKYFLPAVIWDDLGKICRDLKAHGFDFKREWLRPLAEFRFPLRGELDLPGGETLTVRQALEAWPLMAEENLGGPTVRMVDNSTDRLELSLSAKAPLQTHTLLCNGVEIPWQSVGGKPVCGLRYKCASGWPALHPHVPIQAPLLFQWIEKKSRRVKASAWYYYWNPHAPIYDGRPSDLDEARARSAERWRKVPVTNETAAVSPARTFPEMRFTLDLRRHAH
ncbi:transglutaminase family protein [Ruficoccus amylovorans]|uniref:Transglutaminase family protein n=1 Tax=Ruficoccus amylovorans TaxID=1804625 RepID=A0A842HFJ1_9BACT|nr:transglutaminase family protein [Ruficoccus amylovorans]MBC2594808.1 transglutaminase family protein [Ruficoccus amylovorans]